MQSSKRLQCKQSRRSRDIVTFLPLGPLASVVGYTRPRIFITVSEVSSGACLPFRNMTVNPWRNFSSSLIPWYRCTLPFSPYTARINTAPDIISLCARLGQAWQADTSRVPSPFAIIPASLAGISSPSQHLLALFFSIVLYHMREPQVLLVSAIVKADAVDTPRRIVGPNKGWPLITCLQVTSHRRLIVGTRLGASKKIHVDLPVTGSPSPCALPSETTASPLSHHTRGSKQREGGQQMEPPRFLSQIWYWIGNGFGKSTE